MAIMIKSTTLSTSAPSSTPSYTKPKGIDRERLRRFGGIVSRAVSALRHSWRAFVRYKRLDALSDEALAKRRLNRADIGRHAFFGAED